MTDRQTDAHRKTETKREREGWGGVGGGGGGGGWCAKGTDGQRQMERGRDMQKDKQTNAHSRREASRKGDNHKEIPKRLAIMLIVTRSPVASIKLRTKENRKKLCTEVASGGIQLDMALS